LVLLAISLDEAIFIHKKMKKYLFYMATPITATSTPEATSSQNSAIIIGASLGGALLLVIVLLVMVIIIAVVVVQNKKAAVHSLQVDVLAR